MAAILPFDTNWPLGKMLLANRPAENYDGARSMGSVDSLDLDRVSLRGSKMGRKLAG